MLEMVAHQVPRHTSERFLHRGDLGNDVGTIAVLLDHFLESADLAFDPAKPVLICLLDLRIDANRFAAIAGFAGTICDRRKRGRSVFSGGRSFASHFYTPRAYLYPHTLFLSILRVPSRGGYLSGSAPRSAAECRWEFRARLRACYNATMTLVEITYELQSPLNQEQLQRLGEFANTYGLRRFRVDEGKKYLSFEYDASRLRETQVAHVLGQASISVTRKVN